MNNYLIIFNALLYGWVLYRYYKTNPSLNPGLIVIAEWFVIALFGIFYATSSNTYPYYTHELSLLPYLTEFLLFYIAFLPFQNVNWGNSLTLSYSPLIKPLIWFIIICTIPPFIEVFIHLFGAETTMANTMETYQMREVDDNDLIYFSKYTEKLFHQASSFKLISPILLFYYLSQTDKPNKVVVLGLTLASVFMIFFGLSIGNRGPMVNMSIYILFVYLFFKKSLNDAINKKIKIAGAIFMGIVFSYLVLMTVLRYLFINGSNVSDSGVFDWVFQYLGESMINMNRDSFYNDKYLWGELSTPWFYKLFTGDLIRDRFVMADAIGIRTHVFYTHFGQLLLDFPYVLVLVFTLLITILMNKLKRYLFSNLSYFIIWVTFAYILLDGIFICTIQNSTMAILYALTTAFLIMITSTNKLP